MVYPRASGLGVNCCLRGCLPVAESTGACLWRVPSSPTSPTGCAGMDALGAGLGLFSLAFHLVLLLKFALKLSRINRLQVVCWGKSSQVGLLGQ